MRSRDDAWLIRLPDGRVLRAKTTASVRKHIETGRIPIDSWVRRSPEEDWVTLEWSVEFTDLVAQRQKQIAERYDGRSTPAPAARGHDPRIAHDLRQVGVSGLVEELMSALDSTLSRRKLTIAAVAGLGAGTAVLARWLLDLQSPDPTWSTLYWLGMGAVIFLLGVLCTTLLTQMTFVELSRLRPARWNEATNGLGIFSLRLVMSYLLVGGSLLVIIFGAHALPQWIVESESEGSHLRMLAPAATVLRLVLDVLLWPALGLTLLLSPIAIVEECSVFRAIGQWFVLLRWHLSRAFLYEALAAAVATIMTLPFLFPVILTGWLSPVDAGSTDVTWGTLCILTGLALTPLIAYMAVANVFIYLNLRYDVSPGHRE